MGQKLSPTAVHTLVVTTFFPEAAGGLMVDVGAARPNVLSCSAPYRARGWRIVAIEPNPAFCKEHRQLGYEIVHCACADRNLDDVDFNVVDLPGAHYRGEPVTYESYSSLGIPDHYLNSLRDTMNKGQEVRTATIKVPVRTLDTVLMEHAPEVHRIDALSIVAGEWEAAVLRGLSVDKYRPKVVVADNVSGDTSRADLLVPHGYWRWDRIGPKEIFIRTDFRPR